MGYQESAIEFRRNDDGDGDYPFARGIVVYQYGGNLEECIDKARKEFRLGVEWDVVSAQAAK